jgi:hypothetical protein
MGMSSFHAPIALFHRKEYSVATEQGAVWSLDLVLTFKKKLVLPCREPILDALAPQAIA